MRSERSAWRVVALAVAFAVACSGLQDAADAAPVVSAIEPTCGDSSTATPVTLRGSLPVQVVVSISDPDRNEMDTAYRAWLGSVELAEVRWTSASALQAVVPPGMTPGTYGVTVEGPSGKRGTSEAIFEVRQGRCPVHTAALAVVDPLASPATTVVGEQVTVTASVQNDGQAAANGVVASITSAPAAFVLVQGPAGPQDVPGGQARTFTWTYSASASGTGVFVIEAAGSAADTGLPVTAPPVSTNAALVNERNFLTAETVPDPTQATVGQLVTIVLTATNHATSAAVVTPSMAAAGPVTPRTSPKAASIAAGGARAFVWTYTGNAPGTATFTASVSGVNPATGELITLPTAEVTVAVQDAPALSATLTIPAVIELGDFPVTMVVSNSGGLSAATVNEVVPDAPSVHSGSTAAVTLKSGPTGSPATVIAGQPDVVFTWVFTATAHGTLVLTSTARGRDANLETPVASATVSSNQASVGRFAVGGAISGYGDQGLVLQNGAELLPIPTGATRYAFTTLVPAGGSYAVTVATQPTGPETCTVANGLGTVGTADVTDVNVTCSKKTFTVGGTVSGLAGSGLAFRNGSDNLLITTNGSFTFPTPVASGGTYEVTVTAQPTVPSQTCSVMNGSGFVGSAPVTTVTVTCATNPYTIGGTVSGLAGAGLVLHNGSDDLPITKDGSFTFATPVASGGSYLVSVAVQPTGPSQTCTVANGSGTVGNANVTDVHVTCATRSFTVGGSVTGLAGTGLVLRNGSDDLPITKNDSFTFPTPVASGGPYLVSVAVQPTGPSQTCSVTNGSGFVGSAPVTTVTVTCATNPYTIGGTVSGLTGTGLVLHNGSDDLPITKDGSFTFPTPVASGGPYLVSAAVQPTGPSQICTVANGSGFVGSAPVTTVTVTCATRSYTLGGSVTGLTGTGLVLRNGAEDLPIDGNGAYAFLVPVASGGSYAVSVARQPTGPSQICEVPNGAGTVGGANVTNVDVTCTTATFTVSVAVTGLVGQGLVVQNNGGDDLSIGADGSFTFATRIASGAGYDVAVSVQPTEPTQTCVATDGRGTVGDADVTVPVSCGP